MKELSILRIIATVLILCSLTLPLSRCERKSYVLKDGNITAVAKNDPVKFNYQYAKDWFHLREWQGWLVLLSFSWPLVMLFARWKSRKIGKSQVTQWAEILLCLGSGYIFWTISSFGERLFGAYIALSGMAVYLIAVARDTIQSAVRK